MAQQGTATTREWICSHLWWCLISSSSGWAVWGFTTMDFQVRIGSWRLILTGKQILTVSYTKTRLGLLIMAMQVLYLRFHKSRLTRCHGNCPGTGPLVVAWSQDFSPSAMVYSLYAFGWVMRRALEKPGFHLYLCTPQAMKTNLLLFQQPWKRAAEGFVECECVCRGRQSITHVKGQELTPWAGQQRNIA